MLHLLFFFFDLRFFKKYRILEVSCIDHVLLSVLQRYMNHRVYDPCVEIEGVSGTEKRSQILKFLEWEIWSHSSWILVPALKGTCMYTIRDLARRDKY